MPVIAEFTTPDPRTVVMQIMTAQDRAASCKRTSRRWVSGPDGVPRTTVVEAVIGYSDRRHFGKALFHGPAIRPLMGIAAKRLWRNDLAYAGRLFELRS